jgi:hypothetical protein
MIIIIVMLLTIAGGCIFIAANARRLADMSKRAKAKRGD